MLATMSYLYISDMLNRYVIWLTVYVYNMLLSNFDDMKLLFLIVQKKKKLIVENITISSLICCLILQI